MGTNQTRGPSTVNQSCSGLIGLAQQGNRLPNPTPQVSHETEAAIHETLARHFIGQLVHNFAINETNLKPRHKLTNGVDDLAYCGIQRQHVIDAAIKEVLTENEGNCP